MRLSRTNSIRSFRSRGRTRPGRRSKQVSNPRGLHMASIKAPAKSRTDSLAYIFTMPREERLVSFDLTLALGKKFPDPSLPGEAAENFSVSRNVKEREVEVTVRAADPGSTPISVVYKASLLVMEILREAVGEGSRTASGYGESNGSYHGSSAR